MTLRRGLLATVLLALLTAAGLSAALDASPEDLDRQWMAEHLAQHRGLYLDARDLANKITDSSLRQITIAKVMLYEADTSDETRQKELRSEALGLLEKLSSDEGKLARVQVMLDIAKSNGPTVSDSSSILQAIDLVKDLRVSINKRAAQDFNFFDRRRPTAIYETFVGTFYAEMRAYYMLAQLEQPYSEARNQRVNQLGVVFGDLQFEQLHWTKIEFDAYILNGDAQLLNGDVEAAVMRYLDLPLALSMMSVGHPVVREQSLRGYVKAVEALMENRSTDPASMKRVRTEVETALTTYPGARDTFLGKQLIIYDTAASVKLGGEAAPALVVLFGLVEDQNYELRRRAASQLAELALSPALSLAQRHQCVIKVSSVKDYELMLMASQALHSMLASLTTAQQYESYAPYIFVTLGSTYEAMTRFMDAAMIYREGADRLRYWREQNADWEGSEDKLPAHFFGADQKPLCDVEFGGASFRLMTKGDAFEFPRKLAERAKVNAEWLTSRAHGDPNSAALGNFRSEIDRWYLPFAGAEQRFVEVRQAGYRKFNESRRQPNGMVEAAVLLLSTPASDRAAVTASYFAGTGLMEAYTQPAIPQILWPTGVNRDDFFGTGTYTVQGIQFDGLRKRIETEFAKLPAGVRAEQLALLDKLSGAGAVTDRREYLWLFSQFALRQSLVFQMNSDPSRMGALEEPVTLPLAYDAYCDAANQRFLEQPEAERQPSSAMMQAARAVAQLVFTLRNPRVDVVDPARMNQLQDSMRAANRDTVRELLRTSWRNHGPHLDAALNTLDGDERNQAITVMRALVIGLFRENIDSGRVAEAQDAFEAYRRRFAAQVSKDSEEGKQLINMAGEIYNALLRFERPKADAFLFAARSLDAIGVMLGKSVVTEALARQTAGMEADAWGALPPAERRAKVASYIHGKIMGDVIGPEAAMRVRGSSGGIETRPLSAVLPPDEAEKFQAQWAAWESAYEEILRNGVTSVLSGIIASTNSAGAKPELEAALAMIAEKGPDAAAAHLHSRARALPQDDLAVVGAVTGAAFRLSSLIDELGFGSGHAFRSEVRQYIEGRAAAFRRGAKVPMERFLEGNATLRELRGEPLFTVDNASTMAEAFMIVGDTTNAHAALTTWFEARKGSFGDPSFIPVNSERKTLVNDTERAEEIQVRLELAQTKLTLARAERNAAERAKLINEGLHHARRLLQIMQWRDAVVQFDRDRAWNTNLDASETGKMIDRAYVPTQEVYAGLLTLCADLGLKPKWEVKYYAQFWRWLSKEDVEREATEEQRFYKLPVEQAELLSDAANAWWTLSAFGSQPGGFYNHFYRKAYPGWAEVKLKEAEAHARAGRTAEKDAAAGAVVRNVWSEWDRRKDSAFDESSKAYIATLRAEYEKARKVVSIEWMRANAANILEREAGNEGNRG